MRFDSCSSFVLYNYKEDVVQFKRDRSNEITHMIQLLQMLVEHFVSDRKSLLFLELSQASTQSLSMTTQRFVVSQTFLFDDIALLHPVINILAAVLYLLLYARC